MYKFFLFFLLPFSAQAFNTDAMVKFYDKEDFFVLSGDKKDTREYVYATLSELVSVNGKQQEIEYSSENVANWPIFADPSEVILGNNEQVRIRVEKNYKNTDDDRVFGITFIPDLMGGGNKNYNIGFGYKVWMIIPGVKPLEGDMAVTRGLRNGEYVVKNRTNKVLEVDVNYCDSIQGKSCRAQLFIRPNIEKKIALDMSAKTAEFSFYVSNKGSVPVKKIKL
ncbi:hypothetical protein [Edwardsiella tarda]